MKREVSLIMHTATPYCCVNAGNILNNGCLGVRVIKKIPGTIRVKKEQVTLQADLNVVIRKVKFKF